MSVTIRAYRSGDAGAIAALYNRYPDNPNPVAGGLSEEEVERELTGRRTAAFFVGVDGEEVVGTFGLFRHTGRRAARAGELIADMFFVAPPYRDGVLTGRLFTEAITWMFEAEFLVLRLTVNPANTVAFRIYRRVGCVCVGHPEPGEDGNVELYNYIPLVRRQIMPGLGDETRSELSALGAFGRLVGARDDDLRSDVELVDGVRCVRYDLSLGRYALEALIDVDRGALVEATLTEPDGGSRPLRFAQAALDDPVVDPKKYRFGSAELHGEVEGRDGTLRVFGDGHFGPLLTSTWPSVHPDRGAGWRQGPACELQVTEIDAGVRILERHGGSVLEGTVTLVDGVLRQEFRSAEAVRRVFHTVGLRHGEFRLTPPAGAADPAAARTAAAGGPVPGGATAPGGPAGSVHPLGLGLAVRDSSEVVAAARAVQAGTELGWVGESWTVRVRSAEPVALVHSCLMERLPCVAGDGAAVLQTTFERSRRDTDGRRPVRPRPATDGQPKRRRPVPSVGTGHRLRVVAAAAGVVSWTHDGTKVLRSPHPRRRSFACNPRWTAGMWVSTERTRHNRESGLGWGHCDDSWEQVGASALASSTRQIRWEPGPVGPGDVGPTPLLVEVDGAWPGEELVLWLTPRTPPDARVVVATGHGRTWELAADRTWQCWAAAAAVELLDGRWLVGEPGTGAPRGAEVVVRATPTGLLLGCVTHAEQLELTDQCCGRPGVRWQFTVRDRPEPL